MRKYYVQFKDKGKWENSYPIWHFWKFYLIKKDAKLQYDLVKAFYPKLKVRITQKE